MISDWALCLVLGHVLIFLSAPLSLIGFLLSPPKRRPDGMLYWIALSMVSLGISILMLAGILAWKEGWISLGCALLAVPLFLACGLLANTFWAKGVARRIPAELGEEERQESMRKIARRLWWPFLAIQGLILFLSVLPFSWFERDRNRATQADVAERKALSPSPAP